MREKMRKLSSLLAAVMICVMASPLVTFAADAEEYVPKMYASIWSLVPPVVAIALALITKEVLSSLMIGIVSGAVIYVCVGGYGPLKIFDAVFGTMVSKMG